MPAGTWNLVPWEFIRQLEGVLRATG